MAKVQYAFAISSLLYAMLCTRSDIAQVVEVVSGYMDSSRKQNWERVK